MMIFFQNDLFPLPRGSTLTLPAGAEASCSLGSTPAEDVDLKKGFRGRMSCLKVNACQKWS